MEGRRARKQNGYLGVVNASNREGGREGGRERVKRVQRDLSMAGGGGCRSGCTAAGKHMFVVLLIANLMLRASTHAAHDLWVDWCKGEAKLGAEF